MRSAATATAVVLSALALGLAACGDDEDEPTGAGTSTAERTDAVTTETKPDRTDTAATDTADAEDGGGATAPATSPEDQEGGAGDEVPASSQALIVGRDGGFHPTRVRVPPFIAVRVELRSQDGVEYELGSGGRMVKAGGEIRSASTTFEGMRPGERLVLTGPQGRVTISADAEPGP